jgi:restriction system protein
MAKAARQIEAANRRMEREAARREREYEKEMKRLAKAEKEIYLLEREVEVDEKNLELSEKIDELCGILEHTLLVDDTISFDSLLPVDKPTLTLSAELTAKTFRPELEDYTYKVKQPSWLGRMLPGWEERYREALKKAKREYEQAVKSYEKNEADRAKAIQKAESAHEVALQAYEQKVSEVQDFKDNYFKGEPLAIESYSSMVLERSEYPEGFPQEFKAAYIPESKELVVDYEFPSSTVVPSISEYKYIKSRDEIQAKPRKVKEAKELYEDILMAITLRSVHEVFEADQGHHIDTVTFSGYIHATDAATGKAIKPYLVSVRAVKDKFNELALFNVEKRACLRNLGAQVSASPAEIVPVKPVVNFDMYDKRFIEESDMLSTLDSRPNLYELNPFEFEHLICNLFGRMGFQSKLTRSSNDGGVDVVAFDPRPILGGKVVIQAKRYKNTVGVSDVRELWGAIDHERAHKGILITTSGYGPEAFKFAEGKPIELIDGAGLLHLLEQVDIPARIVFPAELKA